MKTRAVLMLACSVIPRLCGAGVDEARTNGLSWLVQTQRGDGSFSGTQGLQVQATASAIEAMLAGGLSRSPQYNRALSWLANTDGESLDAKAWQANALAVAGRNATTIAAVVRDSRNTFVAKDGAIYSIDTALWGTYAGYSSSIPDTAQGYGALRSAGLTYPLDTKQLTATVLCHILPAQLTAAPWAGSWPYAIPQTVQWAQTASGSINATALMLYELKKQRQAARLLTQTGCGKTSPADPDSAITAARNWLISQANLDGGFAERSPQTGALSSSNALSTSLVIRALTLFAAEGDTTSLNSVISARNWLISRQNPDGSWYGDPFITARVLASFPGATGNQIVDSDLDGLPDSVESLLGTNQTTMDSQNLGWHTGDGDAGFSISSIRAYAKKNIPFDSFSISFEQYFDISYPPNQLHGNLPNGIQFRPEINPLYSFDGAPTATGLFESEIFSLQRPNQRLLISFCVTSENGNGDVDGDSIPDQFEIDRGDDPCNESDHPLFSYDDPIPVIEDTNETEILDGRNTVWADVDIDGDLDAVVYRRRNLHYFWPGEYNCYDDCPPQMGASYFGWLSYYENINGSYTRHDIAIGSDLPEFGQINQIGGDLAGGIFVFDFDRDGRRDVLISLSGSATPVLLYRNTSHDGIVTFTDATQTSGISSILTWRDAKPIAILDVNTDGIPDILTASKLLVFNPNLTKYENRRPESGLPPFAADSFIETLDFDSNQKLDITASVQGQLNLYGGHFYSFFINNGNGNFEEIQSIGSSFLTPSVTAFDFADIDGDGLLDLLTFDQGWSGGPSVGRVTIYKNFTDQTAHPGVLFFPVATIDQALPVPAPFSPTNPGINTGGSVGDIDGDGFLDILVSSDLATAFLKGHGGFSFEAAYRVGRFEQSGQIRPSVVDFNLDGSVDVDTGDIFHKNIGYKHGNSISIRLKPTRPTSGTDALGAHVKVQTPDGKTRTTQVRASTSGRPGFLQFGIGSAGTGVVTVLWPSGASSSKSFDMIEDGTTFEVIEPQI